MKSSNQNLKFVQFFANVFCCSSCVQRRHVTQEDLKVYFTSGEPGGLLTMSLFFYESTAKMASHNMSAGDFMEKEKFYSVLAESDIQLYLL